MLKVQPQSNGSIRKISNRKDAYFKVWKLYVMQLQGCVPFRAKVHQVLRQGILALAMTVILVRQVLIPAVSSKSYVYVVRSGGDVRV